MAELICDPLAAARKITETLANAGALPTLQDFAGDEAETTRTPIAPAKDLEFDLHAGPDTVAYLDVVAPPECAVRGGQLEFADIATFVAARLQCEGEHGARMWRISFSDVLTNAAELPLCLAESSAKITLDCSSPEVEVYCTGTWTSGEVLARYRGAHPDVTLGVLVQRDVAPQVDGTQLAFQPGELGPCPAKLALRFATRPCVRRVDVHIGVYLADTLLACDWEWEGATLALSARHRSTGLPLRRSALTSQYPIRLDIFTDDPIDATLVVHNLTPVRLWAQRASLIQ